MDTPEWLGANGRLRYDGEPARWGSPAQAVMGQRLEYLAQMYPALVAQKAAEYEAAWDMYRIVKLKVDEIVELIEAGDTDSAVERWNALHLEEWHQSMKLVQGEAEFFDRNGNQVARDHRPKPTTLATLAFNWAGTQRAVTAETVDAGKMPQALRQQLWERTKGECAGCGTPVLSPTQWRSLAKMLKQRPDAKRPVYIQPTGKAAGEHVPITLKNALTMSPEHVRTHASGGPTIPSNLTSVCYCCQWGRINIDLNSWDVAAYADEGIVIDA